MQFTPFSTQIISLEEEVYTIWLESNGVVRMLDSKGKFVNDVVEVKLAPYIVASAGATDNSAAATDGAAAMAQTDSPTTDSPLLEAQNPRESNAGFGTISERMLCSVWKQA